MTNLDQDIIEASKTAFVDKAINSNFQFKPSFLSNDYKKGVKVLSTLKDALNNCDEFYISVAFITEGGITPLLQDLKELEKNNIKGKILTTNYLSFSEPKALKKLNDLENIEVRMYDADKNPGLHTKGYLFRNEDYYKIIVGSSNITQNALTVNKEWNLSFSSLNKGELAIDILNEFNELWDISEDLDDCLESYEKSYNLRKIILRESNLPTLLDYDLKPNSMQSAFVKNLKKIQLDDESKALLISATGTGKTYAAAFALKDASPKKALFLVHREQIAKQAIKSFKRVFNNNKNFGLLSGNSKQFDADYLFSTMQMMAKEEIHSRYRQDEFDYIIIDEVHRAGAYSYQKIMNYFRPKFYLGMTASPDRTDGFDIYGLFNHNIAYEIRLQQALEEDLLCPFHYFGINDVFINGEEANFNNLISNERVDYIIEKSKYFGFSGDRVKGLIFVSTKKEAKELSIKFNKKGFRTIHLTGENTQDERLDAVERLVTNTRLDYLDYIFTVDIFNEGVDIPEVNQVILLRPTESPIIFIQQLGRGLRKAKNKEFVVILDFIGNYRNNFMIPIALSGDRTYNKDNLRKYLMESNRVIPGNSTINFDRISKERIFESINQTNFKKINFFKEKYNELKHKLGKIPSLVDFYINGEMDPILILNHSSLKSYHTFLLKYEDEYKLDFKNRQVKILEFISRKLANGKRPHELLIIKKLINNGKFLVDEISEELFNKYYIYNDIKSIESAINLLNLSFSSKDIKDYDNIKFFNSDYTISNEFKEFLEDKDYFKSLNDLINYCFLKYEKEYQDRYDDFNLVLYNKYSRSDVCRLLNWKNDEGSVIYGYRIKHNTCPIFVTYHKSDDISKSTDYEDEFIDNEMFSWMTRSNRTIESNEIQPLINYSENKLDIHLFIKKSDGEGTDFYYMGLVDPVTYKETTILNDKGNELPIVNFKLKLRNIVREDIYNYFTENY